MMKRQCLALICCLFLAVHAFGQSVNFGSRSGGLGNAGGFSTGGGFSNGSGATMNFNATSGRGFTNSGGFSNGSNRSNYSGYGGNYGGAGFDGALSNGGLDGAGNFGPAGPGLDVGPDGLRLGGLPGLAPGLGAGLYGGAPGLALGYPGLGYPGLGYPGLGYGEPGLGYGIAGLEAAMAGRAGLDATGLGGSGFQARRPGPDARVNATTRERLAPLPPSGPIASALALRIQEQLTRHNSAKFRNVRVRMAGRTAVLQGKVDSQADAQLVQRLVSLEPGVDGFISQLQYPGMRFQGLVGDGISG